MSPHSCRTNVSSVENRERPRYSASEKGKHEPREINPLFTREATDISRLVFPFIHADSRALLFRSSFLRFFFFSSRRQRRNETKRHSAAHETLDTKPSGTKATACSTRKRRHRSIGRAFFAERFQRPRAWPVDDEESEIPRLTGRTGRFLERTHGRCAKADLSATKGVRLGRTRASWHSAKWHETLLGRSIQFETFPRSIRVLRFATASL